MEWAPDHIKGICKSGQANNFTCHGPRVFFNASVIFGLIGPQRIFSTGSLYGSLQYFWLTGALVPIIVYLIARNFPRSKARFFSAPIFFGVMGQLPPATPLSYLSWSLLGLVFQKFIRNCYRGWWMRFNYITSAGLDVGLAIATIVIIAALNLTGTGFPDWWGNSAPAGALDYLQIAVQKKVTKGQNFGPKVW
jgi:OPT family oligopeptide transporter